MVSLWIVIGLVIAAVSVSILGAGFSVVGLAALFGGAAMAVSAMAIALEFAKFVLAAYLHRRWHHLQIVFRTYLTTAMVILSVITSMGIFGFLSDAYQSASSTLDAESIKLESLRVQKANAQSEIARLNQSVNEIPAGRVSKRLAARAEIEPVIAELVQKSQSIDMQMAEANLHVLEVKRKVGPLIYISKTFNLDIDQVVKYLILLFVFIFDPLAICLVIATSEALQTRDPAFQSQSTSKPAPVAAVSTPAAAVETPVTTPPPAQAPPGPAASDDQIIQMRFSTDDEDRKIG